MVDPPYKVHVIPSVPNEHHVIRYKALRLQALQIDPGCFSSTYDRESSMSYEEWSARLHSSDKFTIAAVTGASIQRSESESETLSPQNEWVGTVTVLGPNFLQQYAFSPPKGIQWMIEENVKYYLFVGVWVHPSHREKGLGKRLVGAGMDWVRADAGYDSTDKQILLLQIMSGNKSAFDLYRSIGFHPMETDKGATNTDIWMGMELA